MSDGINWGILNQAQNPAQGFLSGIQSGINLGAMGDQTSFNREKMEAWREDREASQAAATAAAQEKSDKDLAFKNALSDFKKNPNKDTSFALKMAMPKDMRDTVDQYNSSVTKESIQKKRGMIAPIISLIDNDRGEAAAKKARQVAQGLTEEGDLELAQMANSAAEMLESGAVDAAGDWLDTAFAVGDMEGYEIFHKGKKTGAEAEKIDIANQKAIRENAAQTLRNKSLSGPVRTDYKESMNNLRKDRQSYKTVNRLLDSIPKENIGGVLQTTNEKLKDWWTGGTDDVKSFKQQLASFKLVDMLKNKPPGSLSEGELAVLQAGVPDEGASAEVIKNYLDVAKATIESSYAYERLKLKWVDTFGDINATRTGDLKVFGEPVKNGENLDDFVERMGTKLRGFNPVKTDEEIEGEAASNKSSSAQATPEDIDAEIDKY